MSLGELFLTVSDQTRQTLLQRHTHSDEKEALEFAVQLVLPQNVCESVPTYCDVNSTDNSQLRAIQQALTSVSEAVVPGNSDMTQIQAKQMECKAILSPCFWLLSATVMSLIAFC